MGTGTGGARAFTFLFLFVYENAKNSKRVGGVILKNKRLFTKLLTAKAFARIIFLYILFPMPRGAGDKERSTDPGRISEVMMNRVFNFSAGPSMLPVPVLEKAASELLCYGESGMSVMEMSHRSPDYEAIINDAERMLRNARLDARQELLLAKQNVLDTAFQTAKEKLLNLPEDQYIAWLASLACKASDGSGEFESPIQREEYFRAMSELVGIEISNDKDLFNTVKSLAEIEREYRKIEGALCDVREKGYGIVMPSPEELVLDEPKLTKQAGGWGVKVSAHANSIHMIRTGIKTELCPVVGTEEQSEEVVKYLLGEIEDAPEKVWESNMFGKSLYDLVNDGMNAKLTNIPDESREKLSETLERVMNEGANGLICILL